MYKKCNDWLSNKLSNGLSSMEMFWVIVFLVIAPLLIQQPESLVGWIQYTVSVFLQGVALPVLGAVAKRSGERQEKLLNETHDAVMAELKEIKKLHLEIHKMIKK